TADALGSTRLVTKASGSSTEIAASRRDYLPFGEEITAGVGGRSALWSADATVRQKFTGKERGDALSENGLDYFGARYFSAAQGRWTSPDPTFLSLSRLVNPQRWNMYGYALSNPFRYVDPDGRDAMYVVFKDYRAAIMGLHPYATGHAGMVVVDKSGHTTYREYGRYDTNQGETRSQNVPNLQMDANGHPTDASMEALIETMSKENQNGSVDVIYYDTTDDVDTLLLKELARRMAENKDSKRPPYTLEHHNCGTLFCETMRVAGQTIPSPAQKAWPVDTLQMLLGNSQWWAHYSYDPKQKKTKKKEKVTSTITYIQ
ncbi:MAG: RHS repeat-associated core domain-containing protein, partial [Acidobacteriales bacterium]|nr:RHS repeat-associated core domain-containing protein [Terriglobales bacterium]